MQFGKFSPYARYAKATPPRELPSAIDVKKHVAGNTDAIGYIEKSVDPTVKVVLIVE